VSVRYEAIEVDGKWFVVDHKHPEAEAHLAKSKDEAVICARIWNFVTGHTRKKSV